MKRLVAYVVVTATLGGGFWVGLAMARADQAAEPETVEPVASQPPAEASLSVEEAQIVERLNETRAEVGLPPVTVNPALTEKADDWAGETAETGLRHSELTDGIGEPVCWKKLGENIAEGDTVEGIHRAWLDSPTHYTNLTDPAFTHVGVSVVENADGTLFAVQEFLQEAPGC